MTIELREIAGVDQAWEKRWKIRALVVNGRNPVEAALAAWQREHPNDYRAILKVIQMAGAVERLINPKHVKRSSDRSHGEVYEMIAYTGVARLMFFYDRRDRSVIVCTNEYQKSQGNQNAAFLRCSQLRALYLQNTP